MYIYFIHFTSSDTIRRSGKNHHNELVTYMGYKKKIEEQLIYINLLHPSGQSGVGLPGIYTDPPLESSGLPSSVL